MKKQVVKASTIANFLNSKLIGKDFIVEGPCTSINPKSKKVLFAKKLSQNQKSLIEQHSPILVIHNTQKSDFTFSHNLVENPRLAFAHVLSKYFSEKHTPRIASTAMIGNSHIGERVTIGHNVVIEDDVYIKNDTIIEHNVTIHPIFR